MIRYTASMVRFAILLAVSALLSSCALQKKLETSVERGNEFLGEATQLVGEFRQDYNRSVAKADVNGDGSLDLSEWLTLLGPLLGIGGLGLAGRKRNQKSDEKKEEDRKEIARQGARIDALSEIVRAKPPVS